MAIVFGLPGREQVRVSQARAEATETDASQQIRKILLESGSATVTADKTIQYRKSINTIVAVINGNIPLLISQLKMKLQMTIPAQTKEVSVGIVPRFQSDTVTLMMYLKPAFLFSSTNLTTAILTSYKRTTELLPGFRLKQSII